MAHKVTAMMVRMPPLYRTLPATAIRWLLPAIGLLPWTLAAAHSFGDIDAEYVVAADRVTATIHLTTHDLRHLVDLGGDPAGQLTPAAIAADRDRIAAALISALPLAVGPAATACPAALAELSIGGLDRVLVRLDYRCPPPIASLQLRSGLFRGSDYQYQLHAHVVFASGEVEAMLDPQHNHASFEPPSSRRGLLLPALIALSALALGAALVLWWRSRRPGAPRA